MTDRGVYKGVRCSANSVKKQVVFQGIDICVDRPKGFVMEGKDDKGKPWKRQYKFDYGFIPRTLGGDGDGLDVFLGPDKNSPHAFWAVQTKPDGSFDEYKVFLGFPNRDAAVSAYKDHIPQKLLSNLITFKVDMMKSMLRIDPTGKIKSAMITVSCIDELMKSAGIVADLTEKFRKPKKSTGPLSKDVAKKIEKYLE